MAPAVASPILAGGGVASKRPAATDDERERLDSSPPQGDREASRGSQQQQQRKKKQVKLECPRCRSTNTKFCYYNNYSTSQPRHLCRACRRYWTHGGTLRDVPVGGASRSNKRRRVSAEPSSAASPPQTTTTASDAYADLPGFFPFHSDGAAFLLPQLINLAGFAPAPFSWPTSAGPDLYDCGLAPWDDGTTTLTGAWDIAALDLSWPPPGN
ncbi:hypothetical protein GUJ93_ZPchr0004g38862 [Zizania palustris]|uniref:Dof zinc finger protein n=1 Tax=Zizania palustris TaxID=103762 RepID=A0A8J5VGS8_ZIZPA|nr:hypothetical protein GUJ93_ZPchr0004g38862 [Zizania palustris]